MTTSSTRRTLLRGTAAGAALAAGTLTNTAAALSVHDGPPAPPRLGGRPAEAGGPGGRGRKRTGPRIGVLLYDGYSLLDPTGPAEVLSRLPGAEVTMVAERRGPVRTDTGDVRVMAERSLAETDRLDVLVVPGGGNRGTVGAINNPVLLEWIRRTHRRTRWTTSVCTGSLVLAAAGLLKGRRATTYWASAPYLESAFGVTYVAERYVRSGRIITAAGVSAGLDMSLYLASLISGEETAMALQLAMEYDPQPPFESGNAAEAEPWLKERALRLVEESGT
ncbi:DJ-1/PfpI family protein [Streptomyces sp. CAU 1734]|uniref:DJ-1/PfpI family protein n=1 Tax=Streptomyces sp. CAU 1734 TaxID=3140360 RepID=UPI003261B257